MDGWTGGLVPQISFAVLMRGDSFCMVRLYHGQCLERFVVSNVVAHSWSRSSSGQATNVVAHSWSRSSSGQVFLSYKVIDDDQSLSRRCPWCDHAVQNRLPLIRTAKSFCSTV
eukprot:scaffold34557_cov21-Tisochrysis_lutea.AAC.3